ncbi:hypothetical protein AVEN_150449-1 [Araneus ventricosus]|uniref:Uncharacterized protein n=1 Tax=Araneus ventricosus TaxID=182803 RepID=A0A4Y2WF22_ARAVE|nr:hypothetical protein AVEN_136160-1 [Araneus ventricosus]GBO35023.1 hypothetical protein AVEN_150449-1 [Araneus ventricosus]
MVKEGHFSSCWRDPFFLRQQETQSSKKRRSWQLDHWTKQLATPIIFTCRKGVDGFSVETAGSCKHLLSPSSDSLTLLGHPLCTNFGITKLFVDYVMHSSFAYRQFNSNFTCGDPPKSWHCWSHCPRCLRFPPHNADTTGIWCTVRDTAPRTPLSSCDKFVKHAPFLREEIG